MCRLTKYFPQTYRNDPSKIESAFCIEVDYDPKQNIVTGIVDVYAWSYKRNVRTPLDHIFIQQESESFEALMKGIDWREIFREGKADKKEAA